MSPVAARPVSPVCGRPDVPGIAAATIPAGPFVTGVDKCDFPLGNHCDPANLNGHDQGPFDTAPVGHYLSWVSPFGLRDAAGQVFGWTVTRAGNGRSIVKGESWDDSGCGVCRPAARHGRPDGLKHILTGVRPVQEMAQ